MTIIDAKGMACPLPVVHAKKAMGEAAADETLRVLVDNEIAVQNLTKMAQRERCIVCDGKTEDGNFFVDIARADDTDAQRQASPAPDVHTNGSLVVALSSDAMGNGDDTLGRALMKGFVFALTQMDTVPDTVLLYNSGARLSSEVPESIADLKRLEEAGCEVLTCGTCLNFYGLTDQLAVGDVTNMYAICETLCAAGRIVRP